MTASPYWQPSVTFSALAKNMDIQPMTNWACAENRDGLRPFSAGHIWLTAELSEQDVNLIARLRLNPQQHNPFVCQVFENLMAALPGALCPGGEPHKVRDLWVDELLCLMPPCDHDRLEFTSAAECAATYIERGMAPLLMPLYMLTLRGDTWIRRIQRQTAGPLQYKQPVPDEITRGYDLQELIGDPCAQRQLQGGWTTDFMEARESFFTSYGIHSEADGRRNDQVEDLLFSLDTLAHVAAAVAPVLGTSMKAYDRWIRQG